VLDRFEAVQHKLNESQQRQLTHRNNIASVAKSFVEKAERVSQKIKKDWEQQELDKKAEIIVNMTKQEKQKNKNIEKLRKENLVNLVHLNRNVG
jgi:signal recognition particle GTPase